MPLGFYVTVQLITTGEKEEVSLQRASVTSRIFAQNTSRVILNPPNNMTLLISVITRWSVAPESLIRPEEEGGSDLPTPHFTSVSLRLSI